MLRRVLRAFANDSTIDPPECNSHITVIFTMRSLIFETKYACLLGINTPVSSYSALLYNLKKRHTCTSLIMIQSAFRCTFYCQAITFFHARIWICEYFTLNRDIACTNVSFVKMYSCAKVMQKWTITNVKIVISS